MQPRLAGDEPLPVLVVDDDSALIRTLADILRLNGYAPDVAATATEGLALALKRPPALAVVDLRLPDMDGLELISRLHKLSARTEVVVLTGNASVESAVSAMKEHSIDYLLKPVQVELLLQAVSTASERWQRRQIEQQLKESEERYRQLFDSNPQPLWVFDRETLAFLAVNEAAVDKYGYSREEFAAMTIADIRPREDLPAMLQRVNQPARAGPAEFRHRLRDGRIVDVEIHANDILFGGRNARIVLSVDVTRHRAAVRAQEAVARFGQRALVLDSLGELFEGAVTVVAKTLNVPHATVLDGRSKKKALLPCASIGWNRPTSDLGVVPLVDTTLAGRTLLTGLPTIVEDLPADGRFSEEKLLRDHGVQSGITVQIHGAATPFGVLGAFDVRPREFTQDDVHFLEAIAHIVGDAVKRERSETALRQSQRLEAVGRLSGGIAHDFNNLLTAITGYGEMARSALPPGGPIRDDLTEVLKAAERAGGLTRQLLAFSRQQVLQPRILDLNAVIADMHKMLTRVIGEHIQVVTRFDPGVRRILADRGQVEQVLMNLCVNGRDAMPGGGQLIIETRNAEREDSLRHSRDPVNPLVMLSVTDTGTGMDAETRARIFEPFFTTKAPDHGTGLGLATVYGIVKQSGGDIQVQSEPGHGTTFTIWLPAAQHGASIARTVDPPHSAVGGTETVLLAEDDEVIRRLTKRVLERAGYSVLAAANGAEAEMLAEGHAGTIHLLITDIVMPGINGIELADAIRRTRTAVKALYVSGYSDSPAVRDEIVATGSHFLQKPFSMNGLIEKVREVLDGATALVRA